MIRGHGQRIQLADVPPSSLELLDRGNVRVVDGGNHAVGAQSVLHMKFSGRARPLNWLSEADADTRAAERQGCNSLVFAIESTDGAWHGVLKGALPTGPGGLYYDAVMQKQQQDWLLPAILGERREKGSETLVLPGHPNVLSVLHSFMGSSQLLVPWLGWINE